MQLMHTA